MAAFGKTLWYLENRSFCQGPKWSQVGSRVNKTGLCACSNRRQRVGNIYVGNSLPLKASKEREKLACSPTKGCFSVIQNLSSSPFPLYLVGVKTFNQVS